MLLKPDAILFDMDGVLVDSLNAWWKSLNSAILKYHQQEISREEFIKKYWGRDLEYNLKKMKLNPKVINFCNVSYEDNINYVKIYTDTIPTLKKLNNYKKAIVTNTPKVCMDKIIPRLNLKPYFDTIVTSDEVKQGKPSPDLIFKACKRLNVDAKKTILIGDTSADIQAAKAAGCKVIGMRIDGDYKIEKLSEIEQIIEI
jgi:HAD superfamily hydrolase (TIGR01509 family)